MPKIIQIAVREYLYNIRRPSFLFAAFGTPALIVGIWIILFAVMGNTTEHPPMERVGMVDTIGIIRPDVVIEDAMFIPIPYADEETARADLDAEVIEAYFVVPENFVTTGILPIYTYRELPAGFQWNIRRMIVENLRVENSIAMPLDRIMQPVNEMDVLILDTGRRVSDSGIIISFLAPFFFSILFWISMQTTGNFLMNGLVEEKKNRIIEILVTTVTPMQLLSGKILGLGILGLTQVAIWLGVALITITVGPQIEFLAGLSNVTLPIELIIYGLLFFGFGYIFNASLLAGVGVLSGNEQQSAQYSAIIMLPGYLPPVFLIVEFINNTNGAIATTLSLIPITAPFAMMLRMGFGGVPVDQIALSLGILVVFTILCMWGSAKVFHWGLLLYGKKFGIKELLGVVFARRVSIGTSATLPESQREGA